MKPIFETERLILREFNVNDASFIIELLNSDGWLKYIGDRNIKNIEQAQDYIINGPVKSYTEHGFGLSAVVLKETRAPIGMCGLLKRDYLECADIGFAFLQEYQSKGHAYEIADSAIKHYKQHAGLDCIQAIVMEENGKSIKLLQKLGFIFEKHMCIPNDAETLMLFSNR